MGIVKTNYKTGGKVFKWKFKNSNNKWLYFETREAARKYKRTYPKA